MGKPTPLEGLQCEAFAAGMERESCKYTFPERDHNSFAPSAAGSASWFLLQGKQRSSSIRFKLFHCKG